LTPAKKVSKLTRMTEQNNFDRARAKAIADGRKLLGLMECSEVRWTPSVGQNFVRS
jgi:hypothetical protein